MKKMLLLTFTVLLCGFTNAQNNFISSYLSQYEKDPSFSTVNVTNKTFALFTEITAQNQNERMVLDAIAKLNGIKVLHKEKSDDCKTLYTNATEDILNDDRYEELISVQTQEERFLLMLREEENLILELAMIVGEKDEFLVATLFGEIDLKNITRLTTVIKNHGKEWFKIFENIQSDELVFSGAKFNKTKSKNGHQNTLTGDDMPIRIYPNPVSDYVRLESPGSSEAIYELEFFSIIGEPVKNIGKVSLPYKIQLEDLPSGAYFLRLTNAQGTFKNFKILKP